MLNVSAGGHKKRKIIDYQIELRTYENDIINNAAYSMDILTKDIETINNQSNISPTLNLSNGTFRLTIQNNKRIAICTINSMKLCKNHFIT